MEVLELILLAVIAGSCLLQAACALIRLDEYHKTPAELDTLDWVTE